MRSCRISVAAIANSPSTSPPGACAGIGAEAKGNVGFLIAALAAGFILTPDRKLLNSRYLLLGAALAVGLAAPDVIWQAVHGWPNLAVFHALQGATGHNRAVYCLPQAYSGANNFWLWGPPPSADTTAVAINLSPAFLRREFTDVRLAATFWNGLGISDDEQGTRVYIVSGLRWTWATAWPAFRNYS